MKKIGKTIIAKLSMAAFRALKTGKPFLIKYPDSQPPPMLPMQAAVYTIMPGKPRFLRFKLNLLEKKEGNQNRKNHQMGSVRNLPAMNAQVSFICKSPIHERVVFS